MGKKPAKKPVIVYGRRFGGPDLERCGVFIESSYLHGALWVPPQTGPRPFKGFQMMTEGLKSKNATQAGYFDDEFRRIFEKEAIAFPKPIQNKKSKKPAKVYQPWVPAGFPKEHATPGDFFGTFGGIIPSFGDKYREEKKKAKKLKKGELQHPTDPLTNPGKKGGAGYVGICLSPYPEHKPDPYEPKPKPPKKKGAKGKAATPQVPMYLGCYAKEYFQNNPYQPASAKIEPIYCQLAPPEIKKIEPGLFLPPSPPKRPGNNHDGCFEKFPPYSLDVKPRKEKKPPPPPPPVSGTPFGPQSRLVKKMYTRSVMAQNVDLRMNKLNFKDFEPIHVSRYL